MCLDGHCEHDVDVLDPEALTADEASSGLDVGDS